MTPGACCATRSPPTGPLTTAGIRRRSRSTCCTGTCRIHWPTPRSFTVGSACRRPTPPTSWAPTPPRSRPGCVAPTGLWPTSCGWHASERADADLALTALEYALHGRPVEPGTLIHHSDHGCQYTSIKLTTRLLKAGIEPSTGTIGDSFDNALAENFRSVLKTECVRRTTFATRTDADLALFAYIDGFHNTRRIQKRLDWLSPDEYEAKYYADQATAEPVTLEPPTPVLTR
ncbi:transposase [Kitasatospora sp. NPDC056651]|uniref:transposase n=1 Tax=Kitasatospora sp. NPDC056651 TaxID=3345892 RepID=UPI0036961F05